MSEIFERCSWLCLYVQHICHRDPGERRRTIHVVVRRPSGRTSIRDVIRLTLRQNTGSERDTVSGAFSYPRLSKNNELSRKTIIGIDEDPTGSPTRGISASVGACWLASNNQGKIRSSNL